MSKQNKHTPGPWIRYNPCEKNCSRCADKDYPHGAQDAIVPEYDRFSEIITCDSGVYGPKLADALLICAAPDLLEACEKALAHIPGESYSLSGDIEMHEYLAKVIAKAKGENT